MCHHVCDWVDQLPLFSYGRVVYTNCKDSRHQRWDNHPQYKELIDPGTRAIVFS